MRNINPRQNSSPDWNCPSVIGPGQPDRVAFDYIGRESISGSKVRSEGEFPQIIGLDTATHLSNESADV